MCNFLIFSIIACLLAQTNGKPLRAIEDQNSDAGEAEYENSDELAAEEYQQDEQEGRMNTQVDTRSNGRLQASQGSSRFADLTYNPYKLRNPSAQQHNFENFPELSGTNRDIRNEKTTNANLDSDLRPISSYRQANAYIENNEQGATQNLNDNNLKLSQAQNHIQYDTGINKRAMLSLNTNEEGDLLFEHNRDQVNKLDKSEYTRESADGNEQSQCSKQLYNNIPKFRDFSDYNKYDKLHLNINRDRRQIQKNDDKETNESTLSPEENKELDTVNEDEESAIKRHVKKLTGQELEELFNTLSEDKRALLKKIIETDYEKDNEGINKREITKKAGTVEENNYIENGQIDSSKIQGGCSNIDVNTEPSISHETTDNNKRTMNPTETGEVISNKNNDGSEKPENTVELANNNEDIKEAKSRSNLDPDKSDNEANVEPSSQKNFKTENKRETNINENINMEKSSDSLITDRYNNLKNNQECFSRADESELLDEETELDDVYRKNFKRETSLDEISDGSALMKSLEESFPNSNAYDETKAFSGSNMAPMVRVKRKNAESAMTKRAANAIADSNVPYFPNKGENDDEDNDEGSEFDEDGFYDRTSNYARSNENNVPFDIQPHCSGNDEKALNHRSGQNYGHEIGNLERDTMSLGSDTDNAMTGVEGVNDNLMYNSGSRSKRDSQENVDNKKLSDGKTNDVIRNSKAKTDSDNYINAPSYQETDAFGPLPRNYDGDLGRYKRIRRVKQSPDFKNNASVDE